MQSGSERSVARLQQPPRGTRSGNCRARGRPPAIGDRCRRHSRESIDRLARSRCGECGQCGGRSAARPAPILPARNSSPPHAPPIRAGESNDPRRQDGRRDPRDLPQSQAHAAAAAHEVVAAGRRDRQPRGADRIGQQRSPGHLDRRIGGLAAHHRHAPQDSARSMVERARCPDYDGRRCRPPAS